ncbi:MAG TPA: succinate dehydrogenase, partial [Stellaceae bacterium]
FGERAGRAAATYAAGRSQAWNPAAATPAVERIRERADGRNGGVSAAAMLEGLRELMWREVGPFRDAAGLGRALSRIAENRAALDSVAIAPGQRCNPALADWFELRASLIAAEAVAHAALARCESRGAHQREDFPETAPAWLRNQRVTMVAEGKIAVTFAR